MASTHVNLKRASLAAGGRRDSRGRSRHSAFASRRSRKAHSTYPIRLTAPILPQEYVSAGITLQIVDADGRELRGCHIPDAPAGASCVLERGLRFEPGQEYSARYIVNPGSAYALASDTAPVPLGRGILAGFGGYDTPPDLDAFVVHQYPRLIELQTELDTQTGYVCAAATRFVYALGQPATVDIAFYALDEDGQRGDVAWQAVPAQATAEGVHAFDLLPQDLAFGAYAFEIHATAGDVEERYEGRLIHREKRRGALPLSHPFAKGVDLYDGHAVVSVEDAALGGRGPGLRFTRTYASHSGDDRTALGRGWSSDIDSQVVRDNKCRQGTTYSAGRRPHLIGGHRGMGFIDHPFDAVPQLIGGRGWNSLRNIIGSLRHLQGLRGDETVSRHALPANMLIDLDAHP